MNTAKLDFKTMPISERIELVEDIWDSIAAETSNSLNLSDAQRAELHKRFAEHQADPSSGLSWKHVRAALFKNPA